LIRYADFVWIFCLKSFWRILKKFNLSFRLTKGQWKQFPVVIFSNFFAQCHPILGWHSHNFLKTSCHHYLYGDVFSREYYMLISDWKIIIRSSLMPIKDFLGLLFVTMIHPNKKWQEKYS
jgi:hypothetical protein